MHIQPSPPKKVDARPAGVERGFALVVTLSLMILLTVIAVGLLSLSSISLRASSQGEAMQTARSNARLALMLAIGQLQKEMGPDSRISAPSDAGIIATGGRPKWTAVYDAWKADPDKTKLTVLTPDSRVPKFRTWLVSGDSPVDPSVATEPLVGAKSLGKNPAPGDLVSAPLIELSVSKDPNGPKKWGRMAWWTADEAAKSKINAGAAAESFAAASNPLSDAQSPPHTGPQALPLLSAFEWKPNQRTSAISTGAVNLAAALTSPGIGSLSHDITVHSLGLLTDVREGRLQRDLTNLLTRPIAEVEDKPLYLADGRMNRFVIGKDGSVTNASGTPANERADGNKITLRTADGWGINLEELFLFHNLHKEIEWTGNQPKLVSKRNREDAVADRFFLYRRPVMDAAQFTLSLNAVQDTANPGRYKMQMMIDGMFAISNPNDVTFEYAPGLQLPIHIEKIPYLLTWNIKNAAGAVINSSTPVPTGSLQWFRGYVGGGVPPANAPGFSLEPGESGVFGSTRGSSGYILNLLRGFEPSGGVKMDEANYPLGATNLQLTDKIDFKMNRNNIAAAGGVPSVYENSPAWGYLVMWLGPRAVGTKDGWGIGSIVPNNTPPLDNPFVNQRFPRVIQPNQIRPVSDFVGKPLPFLLFSYIMNVEQEEAGGAAPEAFASRANLLSEPANGTVGMFMDILEKSSHRSQIAYKAEPLLYQFRSLAAGANRGSNVYHGGSRQINQGGSLYVIKRRTPIAPPLSLGAFENAIASGFARRFKDHAGIKAGGVVRDPFPATARTLSGDSSATPAVAKAIGNSYASPFLAPNEIYQAVNLRQSNGGSDHSWMVNNALWDSWFLSGIVDGQGLGSNRFQTDGRSPRAQFSDLAKSTGLLRNQRFLFHPHKPADEALKELFTGDILKPSAINDLSKYLLIDGAFNVNSTSAAAWKGLLTSVRKQKLIVSGGGEEPFGNPYGTLGYAQDRSSTSDWSGLRDLSEADIVALSQAIVEQVKARGPFLNLGDFVNRRPNGSTSEQAMGALQAAIDKSGLNSRFTGGRRSIAAADFGTLAGAGAISAEPAPARAAGSAGHLTQARLLTALGPQITVRSDTFVIRTYGDARDATGKIVLAKAWCEAVVQRVPEYVDPEDSPEAAEGWPKASDKLTTLNSLFGRRLEIRSFRWLSSSEI